MPILALSVFVLNTKKQKMRQQQFLQQENCGLFLFYWNWSIMKLISPKTNHCFFFVTLQVKEFWYWYEPQFPPITLLWTKYKYKYIHSYITLLDLIEGISDKGMYIKANRWTTNLRTLPCKVPNTNNGLIQYPVNIIGGSQWLCNTFPTRNALLF